MNNHNDDAPEPAPPPPRQPFPRKGNPLLVFAVVIVAVVLVAFFVFRDGTPRLTPEALDGAQKKWQESGVTDYDVTLSIEIERQAITQYVVGVRGREVVALKINGSEKSPRDDYSIDGVFGWLERELELTNDAGKGGGPANLKGAILRARFDDVYGYPELYKRMITEKASTFIRVTSFVPAKGV